MKAYSRISLRQADDSDLEVMLAWGSHPEVCRYLPSRPETLTWELHYAWWKSRQHRVDWIIQLDDGQTRPRAVGEVHLRDLNMCPEIGLYIGEVTLWNKGVGKKALKLAMEWAWEHGLSRLQAVVHPRNKRSQRLFEGLGFVRTGTGRKGQWRYERGRPAG